MAKESEAVPAAQPADEKLQDSQASKPDRPAEGEINLTNRFVLQAVTTEIVWGVGQDVRPGVLAEIFDRKTKQVLKLALSAYQISSASAATPKAREQLDRALEAIEDAYRPYAELGALYGPMMVLKRGPGH